MLEYKSVCSVLKKAKKHDERRVLANGEGTFDVVFSNLIEAVRAGLFVTLRINIDEKNVDDISEIVDGIPMEFRPKIAIDVCNIFQNKERISTDGSVLLCSNTDEKENRMGYLNEKRIRRKNDE